MLLLVKLGVWVITLNILISIIFIQQTPVKNQLTHTAGMWYAALIFKAARHIVSHLHAGLSLCGAEEQVNM